MAVSYRQAKRLWRRYGQDGDAGVVHGLRGRRSNHRGDPDQRRRVLALYRQHYRDFGPTLAAEQLAKRQNLEVNHETLRRWLVAAGLWQRGRKRSPHRQWRPPKAHFGELVQLDGSEHDWFEGRGPRCVLMVMIDDATQRTLARFFPAETTEAALRIFRDYARRFGLPQCLYPDRDSIYRINREPTTEEALAGSAALTQFGRAMKELGVELRCAHSPQAKGRVERRHGVFQDRLVKELRLEGIADLEAANAYLQKQFLPDLNRRFTRPAAAAGNWHRPVPPEVKLDEVLSIQEERVVQNDWTVRWRNRWLQVTARERKLSLAGKAVVVRELLDGRVQLVYRGRLLACQELSQRAQVSQRPAKAPKRKPAPAPGGGKRYKPPANHPWRRWRLRPTPPTDATSNAAQPLVNRLVQDLAQTLDARRALVTRSAHVIDSSLTPRCDGVLSENAGKT
jgi:hypothetical protein